MVIVARISTNGNPCYLYGSNGQNVFSKTTVIEKNYVPLHPRIKKYIRYRE